MSNIKLARMLGWTSLAVGVTELAATKWLEEQMGVDDRQTLIRAFGAREIAAGVMILSQPGLNPQLVSALWARVGGDAIDLALLGLAERKTSNPRGLAAILGIVLAVTGLDVLVAGLLQRDLLHAHAVTEAARQRVTPTVAMPNGAARIEAKGTNRLAAIS